MSSRPALLALVAACAVLAGCGGGQVSFSEAPGEQPSLPLQREAGAAAPTASVSATPTPDDDDEVTESATAAPVTTAAPAATAAPVQTATAAPPVVDTGPDTGGAAPPSDQTTTEPPADTGGGVSAPSGDDQFCADNPGACNE